MRCLSCADSGPTATDLKRHWPGNYRNGMKLNGHEIHGTHENCHHNKRAAESMECADRDRVSELSDLVLHDHNFVGSVDFVAIKHFQGKLPAAGRCGGMLKCVKPAVSGNLFP